MMKTWTLERSKNQSWLFIVTGSTLPSELPQTQFYGARFAFRDGAVVSKVYLRKRKWVSEPWVHLWIFHFKLISSLSEICSPAHPRTKVSEVRNFCQLVPCWWVRGFSLQWIIFTMTCLLSGWGSRRHCCLSRTAQYSATDTCLVSVCVTMRCHFLPVCHGKLRDFGCVPNRARYR